MTGHRRLINTAVVSGDRIAVGEGTFNRRFANGTTTQGSGILRLTMFTATKTETITQVKTWTSTTAAAPTPTIARFAVYTVDASGNLVEIAHTANDTTLFAAQNTPYTKAFQASFGKVAGQRYAVGLLVVSGAATPTITGQNLGGVGTTNPAGTLPMMCSSVSGLSDLPGDIAVGSLATNASASPYFDLLP